MEIFFFFLNLIRGMAFVEINIHLMTTEPSFLEKFGSNFGKKMVNRNVWNILLLLYNFNNDLKLLLSMEYSLLLNILGAINVEATGLCLIIPTKSDKLLEHLSKYKLWKLHHLQSKRAYCDQLLSRIIKVKTIVEF